MRTGSKFASPILNQHTPGSPVVQKVVSNVISSPSNSNKIINSSQGLQQLIVQPGQKLLVGQNAQGQKVIIQPTQPPNASMAPQPSTPSVNNQQQIVVNQANQLNTEPQQPQKVIQQIVNTSNVQQQIVVGGQRIILSPGQTIVTQRSLPAQNSGVQVVQSPTASKSVTHTSTNLIPNSQTKIVKQLVIQPQTTSNSLESSNQTSHSSIKTSHQVCNSSSSSGNTSNNVSNQQIIVQNSTLAQQLAQGKLQVATINGQQVIIKPLGNNQAQIVAHIKTQSDGNAHIVTNTQIENQISPTKTSPVTQSVQVQQVIFMNICFAQLIHIFFFFLRKLLSISHKLSHTNSSN